LKTDASDSDVDIQIISAFASRYSLCWSISTDDIKPIVRGDNGLIYLYSESPVPLLGVAWCPDELTGDQWNSTIRAQLHCGMQVVRDYAVESYSSLSGENPIQSALAMQLAGIKPASNSARLNAKMLATIAAARQRKTEQIKHQRIMKRLALERAGVDLSDYDSELDVRWLGENVTL
jgi:hypothetical protein